MHSATPVEQPPTTTTPATPGTPAPPSPDAKLEACVDKYLAEHHLNEYGDPEGTVYTGGTPLFDERTGKSTPRLEYVFAKQPGAKTACAAP